MSCPRSTASTESPRNLLARIGFSVGCPCRARHLATAKGLAGVCGFKQDSRCRAASLWLPTKISKTTPCKVAGGRRQRRFGPILDTSGKSAALLHHRRKGGNRNILANDPKETSALRRVMGAAGTVDTVLSPFIA